MRWFKHFTDAHDNNDLTKVRMKYGADGYAVYWYCLELIAGDLGTNENINFELKHDAEVIGLNLKIDRLLVEEIMNYMVSLELFEQSFGKITCLKLAKYLDKKLTRNKRIHEIVDASKLINALSGTYRDVPGHAGTCPDVPGRSPLDTDTDTEELIDTSDSQANSDHNPAEKSVARMTKRDHEQVIAVYHEVLPELSRVVVSRWHGSANAKQLAARWREEAAFRDMAFWRTFFETVRHNPWWMGIPDKQTGAVWDKCNLAWLVKRSNFDKVLELGVKLDRCA